MKEFRIAATDRDLPRLAEIAKRSLIYTAASPPNTDRPAWVRAASGICFHRDDAYVIQDDACFVAKVSDDRVDAIATHPRAGQRVFSELLGNKKKKPDYESCLVANLNQQPTLLAFGSGSLRNRRSIAKIDLASGEVVELDGSPLHEQVEAYLGHLPNIEGAVVSGDLLWWFHRGNTGKKDRGPAAFAWQCSEVFNWLAHQANVPQLRQVVTLDLGTCNGVPLGITDACIGPAGEIFVVCAAEASDDAVADGSVAGARFGEIVMHNGEHDSAKQWAAVELFPFPIQQVQTASGERRVAKPEGCFAKGKSFFVVCDPDDTELPTELIEFHFIGG